MCFKVQFGHAGACANAERETAVSKNSALCDAGAKVPKSFDELGDSIECVSTTLRGVEIWVLFDF